MSKASYQVFCMNSSDLYAQIDNWSARINSLQELNIDRRKEEISFLDLKTFLELWNFLTGEFDLLYHGIIEVERTVLHTREGYSHDSLREIHLKEIKKLFNKYSKIDKKQKEIMKAKWEATDLQILPKGKILDEGLKLLKDIIKVIRKKFTIEEKETDSNTPYVLSFYDERAKEKCNLSRYDASIDFKQQLKNHPWSPKPQTRKRKKNEEAVSSNTAKLNTRKRPIIVDDDEDSKQATPSGNDSSSKQAVPFVLPETANKYTSDDSPQLLSSSISTALIALPQSLEHNEISLYQTSHDFSITDYPFTNSKAISIIKKEEGSTDKLIGMVSEYLISEETNDRRNFEHILYSLSVFRELKWSFHDFFIGFEEMVLTTRTKLLQDNPMEEELMAVAIKRKVVDKDRDQSLKRARQFIKKFSLQIFELFQAFHKCESDLLSTALPTSIALLWPLVDISEEEMSKLISMLSDNIGQIAAEDLLFINLSGKGFLRLREELYKYLASNVEIARCVHTNQKQRCIVIIETFVKNEAKEKEFSFSAKNSDRLWKFLGDFYNCTLTKTFKQSAPSILETSITESPSTPLNLSALTKSVVSLSLNDSYALRSKDGKQRKSSGGVLESEMAKLIEARERVIAKSRAKAAAKKAKEKAKDKAKAKASTEIKVGKVQKSKKRKGNDDNIPDSDKNDDEFEWTGHEIEGEEEGEGEGEGEVEEVEEKEVEERVTKEEEMAAGRDKGLDSVKLCQFGEESNDMEATERRDRDSFETSFYQECRVLYDSYIDIEAEVEEDYEEDNDQSYLSQSYLTENSEYPSLDNPQAVLEWLYTELKDVFTMDVILKSLQAIILSSDNSVVLGLSSSSSSSSDLETAAAAAAAVAAEASKCDVPENSPELPSSSSSSSDSFWADLETAKMTSAAVAAKKTATKTSAADLKTAAAADLKTAAAAAAAAASKYVVPENLLPTSVAAVDQTAAALSSFPPSSSSNLLLTSVAAIDQTAAASSSSSSSSSSSLVVRSRDWYIIAAEYEFPNEVKLNILEYIHKDLCHIISIELSNHQRSNKHLFQYCDRRRYRVVPDGSLPFSLLFRANLFMDGFELPPRINCLKLFCNLNWNTEPLMWYAKKHTFTWPTCTQACIAKSHFALTWARMNRCSCIYDMRYTFPKLSPIEKDMLTWLEKEVRPQLHARAGFHGQVDTPIKLIAREFVNGNCLWNAFITGQIRILQTHADIVDDIDRYILVSDITKAAEFDRSMIPVAEREKVYNKSCPYDDEEDDEDDEEEEATKKKKQKASSHTRQSNANDSNWDFENSIRATGGVVTDTAQGICFVHNFSLNASIALTLMGQVTRLFILENPQVYSFDSVWRLMAMQLFSSGASSSTSSSVNQFINAGPVRESVPALMLRSCTHFNLGKLFVRRQQFTLETDDSTVSLASKLIEKLSSYNVNTGIYVFEVQGKVRMNAIVPILLRTNEEKHYQCVAAVYRSSSYTEKVSMRLVTRSLTGVCDYCYYISQCNDKKGNPPQLGFVTPSKISTKDEVFPCRISEIYDQLHCLVFIPTFIQTSVNGSNYSLRLNDSIETIRKPWTVKDYLSFEASSHLTKLSLETMVCAAYSHFKFEAADNQDFFVSDTLIEELVALHTTLHEEPSSEDIYISPSMVKFSRNCVKMDGILHLLLGYKDVNKETVWLYAYYLRRKEKLVFLPCSTDTTRDVMMAASTIKNYLQTILQGISNREGIPVKQIQWKVVSTSSSNSGLLVFKQFLVHAIKMIPRSKKNRNEEHLVDYLSMHERDCEIEIENDKTIPGWILRNFTKAQMQQIINTWRTEIFTHTRPHNDKLYELLTF